MLNKNNISCISKSPSFDSLNTQSVDERSILSSTRDQEKETKISNNNNRRKAILPTPHKPRNEQDLGTINSKTDSSNQEQETSENDNRNKMCIKDLNISEHIDSDSRKETLADIDKSNTQNNMENIQGINRKQKNDESYKSTIKTSDRSNKNVNDDNEIEHQVEAEDETNDDSFDTFILQNFVPYSGRGNVISWLDATEEKFNQNCIGRNLRFDAISLLVEGDAKRKYIKHRKEIRSYDDFYEFLLSEFDTNVDISCPPKSCQNINNQSSDLTASRQMKSVIESNQYSSTNSNSLNITGQLPLFSSTVTVNPGITNSIGEKPAVQASTISDSLSNTMFDKTLNDLRKAIVGNLIKNPKTFKGSKDDVKKWIEEIEHLLELAHIPESTRLDLISYSLRGDALEWYKNNRASFTSWTVFVHELKKAFTSSFHEELAFKKLESYSQGENQSIRSFFNEVLKLCKETDPSMSEATKLKNLLSKTKPSIQFEVRKKKPTSTTEFLEYAKEAEELIQLSNMSTETTNSQTSTQVVQQQPILSSTPTQVPALMQSFNYPSNNSSSNYSKNFNKNDRFTQNRNSFPNRNSSSFSNNKTFQNKSRFNNNSSQSYRPRNNNSSINKNNDYVQTSRNSFSNTTHARQRTANAIDLPPSSPHTDTLQETFSSIPCSRCSQFGHEASACPNF